jgi:hypothetical protein
MTKGSRSVNFASPMGKGARDEDGARWYSLPQHKPARHRHSEGRRGSPDFAERLSRLPALVLKASKTDGEVVHSLYLATLLRQPRKVEAERTVKLLKSASNREEACRDLLIALVNSSEFMKLHNLDKDFLRAAALVEKIVRAWEKK